MKKKAMAAALTALMTMTSAAGMASAADNELDVFVDQTQIGVKAFEENGKIMVPVRAVCEALDMEVFWNGQARRVEITKLPIQVTFSPEKDGYTFAKTAPMKLGTAPQLLGAGITYVPSEFFGEIIPVKCEVRENRVNIIAGEQPAKDNSRKMLVTESRDKQISVYDPLLGEVIVNITDETEISAENGKPAEKDTLIPGTLIEAEYSPVMTASLPPITSAKSITILEGQYELMETTVRDIREDRILVGGSDKITEQTLLVKTDDFFALDKDGNVIENVKNNSKITAVVSMASTRSIPPQRNVCFIRECAE